MHWPRKFISGVRVEHDDDDDDDDDEVHDLMCT